MASLFISYSRKDIEAARKLTDAFKGQGLDFWIDWEGIPPTVDWWQEIEKGIEEAELFLFLISADSCRSEVCRKEIVHAVNNGKRLIPVVVGDVKAEEAPQELRHLNWIFLRATDDFEAAFKKLVAAAETDYVWVQAHRQLQVKALEWERSTHENSFLLRGKELQDAELQLATNASKEPHPTDLQREYVLRSRQASDRQRRVTRGIAVGVMIALASLTLIAFLQAGAATRAEGTAVANAAIAETERANAVTESNARATAQENAERNQKLAEERATLALARQLAVQAQSLFLTGNAKQMTAVLLAVQSMRLFPTGEAAQVLQTNVLAYPVAEKVHDGFVEFVTFSSNGNYVLSRWGYPGNTARVWDVATGQETFQMTPVYAVAFSPDGKQVVSAGADSVVQVWEVTTGNEIARMKSAGDVSLVAYSPDGKYVISGGGDGEDGIAQVWEVATGKQVSSVAHPQPVNIVAFSPDGTYVVSASADDVPNVLQSTVRVWEPQTGREIASLVIYNGSVMSLAISSDSRYLISGSDNYTACVWEVKTGTSLFCQPHEDVVTTVAFSPDGNYVASGSSQDNTACIIEFPGGKEIACIRHEAGVSSVAFSPDGRFLLSASYDHTARLLESATGREVARLTEGDSIRSVAFGPMGNIVTGSNDGTVRIWEAVTGAEISRMTHDSWVLSLAFSPDSKHVVSGSLDDSARVWESSSGKEISHITFPSGPSGFVITPDGLAFDSGVRSLSFSPDGKYVAAAGCDRLGESQQVRWRPCDQGSVLVWEIVTGKVVVHRLYPDLVGRVAFSPDGKWLLSSMRGTIELWEVATGKSITEKTYETSVTSFAFSPHGNYVVSSSYDVDAQVWESATGKVISSLTHFSGVCCVAFSPDGNYVVSGSGAMVRVWEAATGTEIAVMLHEGDVTSVAFSPDGTRVASGSKDGTARIWEVATEREVARMTHDGSVNTVSFSPHDGGKHVLSASDDATVRVWVAATGQEIARMTHADAVRTAIFSPDGHYVASGGFTTVRVLHIAEGDTTARVWIWQPEDLVEEACSRVTRNLTRAEWKQYIGDGLTYEAICPGLEIESEPTPIS